MTDELVPYEEIRRRVEARIKRRARAVGNLAVVLLINAFTWVAWSFTDPMSRIPVWVPLFLSAVFIIAFIYDLTALMMAEWQEREIRREIERERQRLMQMREKPKRDEASTMQLSDDGELVEIEDYDADVNVRQKSEFED